MSLVQSIQPTIRFSKAGPHGFEGVSYAPKVITFNKDDISGTSNDDFWAAPAGTFIALATIVADAALDGTPVVTLGTDGNPDALIDATGFDATSTGNFGSSIASTTASNQFGLYLSAADNIRLAISGAPTAGAVSGHIVYYELAAMQAQGVHFDLT
jgi:hypothetical protein